MEHAEETAHIISDAENLEEVEHCLCERFELERWEVRTWLDTNIIFATRSDIVDKRKDIEELQERFDILSAQSNVFDEI